MWLKLAIFAEKKQDFSKLSKLEKFTLFFEGTIGIEQIQTLFPNLDEGYILGLTIFRDTIHKDIKTDIELILEKIPELKKACLVLLNEYDNHINEARKMLLDNNSRELFLDALVSFANDFGYFHHREAGKNLSESYNYETIRPLELKFLKENPNNFFAKEQDLKKEKAAFIEGRHEFPELEATSQSLKDDYTQGIIQEYLNNHSVHTGSLKLGLIKELENEFQNNIHSVVIRTKDVLSLQRKLAEKENSILYKVTDILGIRIILGDYRDVEKMGTAIEKIVGSNHYKNYRIIEHQNKIVQPNEQRPYRAIHYLIKINSKLCFEIQIKTLRSLLLGEIEHVLMRQEDKKQELKESLDLVQALLWGLDKTQLEEYTTLPIE